MNEFLHAATVDEVADGQMHLAEVDDRLVIIIRESDNYFCIDDVCTHDGGTLSDGQLEGCQVICPRHGARFDAKTGDALTMPATEKTGCHEVKVDGDNILVKINES